MTGIAKEREQPWYQPFLQNKLVAGAGGAGGLVIAYVICAAVNESKIESTKVPTETGAAAALAAFVKTLPMASAPGKHVTLPQGPTGPTGDRNTDELLHCDSLQHGELHGFLRWRDTTKANPTEGFVSGAFVILRITDRAGHEPPRFRSWTQTNEYGAFVFDSVPTGAFHIFVAHPKARGLFWPPGGLTKDGYYDAVKPACLTPNEIRYVDLVT